MIPHCEGTGVGAHYKCPGHILQVPPCVWLPVASSHAHPDSHLVWRLESKAPLPEPVLPGCHRVSRGARHVVARDAPCSTQVLFPS